MILRNFPLSKYIFSVAFFALAFSLNVQAEHEETHAVNPHEQTAKKFDAGKMIIEHISDAHDWHIMDWSGHPVSLPLPVILYTDKGMDFFMSSKFEHGHA